MPLGASEMLIILVIVLVVFGANKLPKLGDGLGKAIKNFKRAVAPPPEIDETPENEEKKIDKGQESSQNDSSTCRR